ncbi:hypothetical protein ANO11243_090390 [Dothideomycetidae sp. 11243]|nr:hypothetical protein ANO11243_090390 [fungal sp. No.11243]
MTQSSSHASRRFKSLGKSQQENASTTSPNIAAPPSPSTSTEPGRPPPSTQHARPRFSVTDQLRSAEVSDPPHVGEGDRLDYTERDLDHGTENANRGDHPSKRLKVVERSLTLAHDETRSTIPKFTPSQAHNEFAVDRPKPAFVKSAASLDAGTNPLPEIFSPHRRGQRFVPGGMAAELQSWITEVGNRTLEARRSYAGVGEPEHDAVLQVEGCNGSEVLFVRGRGLHGGGQQAVLVRGAAHALVDAPLPRRTRVGIREPFWSITLDTERWMIAVVWKVL